MNLIEARRQFNRDLVKTGVRNPAEIKKMYPLGTDIPREKMEGWLKRLTAKLSDEELVFPGALSSVNRFLVGADPEFVLVEPKAYAAGLSSAYVHASTMKFRTGQAYGADGSGRQVEIRPKASRSALKVLASMMSTLRWMAIMTPGTRKLDWHAGAYKFSDGLGGHVHFGRKSPTSMVIGRATEQDEVRALDAICETFLLLGIYPMAEMNARRKTQYGKLGDIRKQTYGYEYRTFPSWMDNPWSAYLSLTCAKLAVVDPTLVERIERDSKQGNRIENLLAYYQGRDDDAKLCYTKLQMDGFPKHYGGDFKGRWGAEYDPALKSPVDILPKCIDPSAEELRELWEYFARGKALKTNVPPISWGPIAPPPGYYAVASKTETARVRGLGEVVAGLLGHEAEPLEVIGGESAHAIVVSSGLVNRAPKGAWKKAQLSWDICPIKVESGKYPSIRVGVRIREDYPKQFHNWMLMGQFPLWAMEGFQDGAYERWKALPREASETVDYSGLIGNLVSVGGIYAD